MDNTDKLDDVRLTYEQKLEVAMWIIDNNSRMLLTGSIMLKERGIDLGREPNDIDILVSSNKNIEEVFMPPLAIVEEVNMEDGYIVKARYKYLGTKIEFISSDEDISKYFDLDYLASVDSLLEAKRMYVENDKNPECVEKHRRDIEIIEKAIRENSYAKEDSL